ncbi:MAG: type II toxin-antitoxin system VapC family toxin [Polyangiales bacterium]
MAEPLLVLDASVALKWFFPKEVGHQRAMHVLTHLTTHPTRFVVPEFFFNEVLAVLCRSFAETTTIQTHLRDLEDLGIERIGNGHALLQETARLARLWRLSAYDALYVATASLMGGRWLSADDKAIAKVREPSLALSLGAWPLD